MSRHNGRAAVGHVACPGCGRDVSYNHLGTLARHNVAAGQRDPAKVQVCAASLRHRKDRPSRYVVCCGHCSEPPWAPAEWCDAEMHDARPVRVA